MSTLNRWFEQSKAKADFRVVYINEAHPTDGWQVEANERQGVLVATHKSMEDRQKAAAKLRDDLKLNLPIVVDLMDDKVNKAYSAWPDRIFIVGKDGKIAYRGAPGPRGFNPQAAMKVLDEITTTGLHAQ